MYTSCPLVLCFSLPKVVKRRIKALKKLQFDMIKEESEFYKEVHELECKYAAKYAPIFNRVSIRQLCCCIARAMLYQSFNLLLPWIELYVVFYLVATSILRLTHFFSLTVANYMLLCY